VTVTITVTITGTITETITGTTRISAIPPAQNNRAEGKEERTKA
jgi:hypothetical protein